MISSADMFMASLAETSSGGFLALGNMKIPTEDGKLVGSVSAKGTKEQVLATLASVKDVLENFSVE